jgi:hypothetical protein
VTDEIYNCEPHALDYPVDQLERLESQDLENALREGAVAVAEVAALAHEKSVIDAALVAAGAGTGLVWGGAAADPVADVDSAILAVVKAAKYGSLMGVGVLFGASAWVRFKNAEKVRGRFVVGRTVGGRGEGVVCPTEATATNLFVGSPEVRTSYMVYDDSAPGLADNVKFLLDDTVLIFARRPNPTRRDPSFMKTFRLMGKYMVPSSYLRDDGRVEVAKFDWSEDIRVTNGAAVVRLNVSAS